MAKTGQRQLLPKPEPRHPGPAGLPALRKAIHAEAFLAEGVLVHHVVLCAKRTVEKTTSGKKRRRVLRERYLAGQLHILGEEVDVRQAVV